MDSALHAQLMDLAGVDRLLVVLDFDGTISPIVPVPGDARPLPGALDRIAELGQCRGTEVYLLSGRARHDLAQVSGAGAVAGLIGSHGQESGAAFALTDAEQAALGRLRSEVQTAVSGVVGVRVEDKPAGLAVHVRGVEPEHGQRTTDRVRAIAEQSPDMYVLEGKSVIEVSVRPLDKGAALQSLIEADPERRVLFAGDDVTDESAMAVLRAEDVSLRIGPGQSLARHRVPGPPEMVEVLAVLARQRSNRQATNRDT